MKRERKGQQTGCGDIWVIAGHRDGNVEQETYGLIAEARRINSDAGWDGAVTAIALGCDLKGVLDELSACAADRVICVSHESLGHYHGELFSLVLYGLVDKYSPSCILMAQAPENGDLSSRLAAIMETALVTRAVDFRLDEEGRCMATRPVANGYLFENLLIPENICPIICFMPSVLGKPGSGYRGCPEIIMDSPDMAAQELKTRIGEVIEAVPEELDIKEADVIVAGGRGLGPGESFKIVYELAAAVGGSVGGTRPVIDWNLLPFERQIGQTGKTVAPRLLIACGISGANEFTAGMENAGMVIAINKDPNARIFKFADIGIIGDAHEVIPVLVERIKEVRE
ncbi:MAG: electron transfer flavoprotein subunit alpha/FixB family protein [Deltaproteobacteria bacterium]|nr:electron transfer flavoprotein subunit alpha/FixB family protein [Deltaproteobacteria bacterium]